MYWEQDQEITLLHLVLETMDPSGTTSMVADPIICGLIEMGLVDCDRAPNAQQAWNDEWEGYDVPRDFIAKHYRTDDEILDDEDDG